MPPESAITQAILEKQVSVAWPSVIAIPVALATFLAACSQPQRCSRYAPPVQAAMTGLLVGAVHAFLLSLALLTKGKNAHASRYLAALVFSLGVLLLSSAASVAGYMRAHPHLIALDAPLPLLFGPLLYLYVRALTGDHKGSERRWLHAVPFAAYVAFLAIGFWWRSPGYKLAFLEALIAGDEPLYVTVSDLGKFVLGIGYTSAALRHLRRHRIRIEEYFAHLRTVALLYQPKLPHPISQRITESCPRLTAQLAQLRRECVARLPSSRALRGVAS